MKVRRRVVNEKMAAIEFREFWAQRLINIETGAFFMDNDDDFLLKQSLSNLSEVSAALEDEEVEEVARVRKARADVTEHARQSGDSVGNLIGGLLDDSNAIIEAEKAEKERKARETAERARAAREAAEAKKRKDAEDRLNEEKRKLEEKEQKRLQMLAEMEKKRKLEAGEVDEEEEARKRMEAEAEARRIAAEEARERAEDEALNSANQELAERLAAAKATKAAQEAAEAHRKWKAQVTKYSIIAAIALGVIALVTVYFVTLKAPDYYTLNEDYPAAPLDMQIDTTHKQEWVMIADSKVQQTNPNPVQKKSRGPKKPTDAYGIGSAANVFGTGKIVK